MDGRMLFGRGRNRSGQRAACMWKNSLDEWSSFGRWASGWWGFEDQDEKKISEGVTVKPGAGPNDTCNSLPTLDVLCFYDTVEVVHCRPNCHGKGVDGASFKQIKAVSLASDMRLWLTMNSECSQLGCTPAAYTVRQSQEERLTSGLATEFRRFLFLSTTSFWLERILWLDNIGRPTDESSKSLLKWGSYAAMDACSDFLEELLKDEEDELQWKLKKHHH